jgi:hypothetical protein
MKRSLRRDELEKLVDVASRLPWEELSNKELEELDEHLAIARYSALERYLRNGHWEEADNETYRLMITEVGKEEGQWFNREDLLNFPCEPLRMIDRLWIEHSGGKFGFSVQKKIYIERCGGVPDGQYDEQASKSFIEVVGWGSGREYDISSFEGHLPYRVLVKYGEIIYFSLLSHPNL